MAKASELESRIQEVLKKGAVEGQKITDLAAALNMNAGDAAVRRSLQSIWMYLTYRVKLKKLKFMSRILCSGK